MSENTIQLDLDDSNRVVVYLHGATITSWVSSGQEILFVSKKSVFDNKKAIRGGIPVVFPNFGPWDNGRPQHGFARTKRWNVKEPVNKTNDSVNVTLSLSDDEETRNLWNFNFELLYEITLTRNSLRTNLVVKNTGKDEFDFTSLLHTYFRLDNIDNAKIYNLNELEYVDKVRKGITEKETNQFIKINEEVDRVYISTPDELHLETGNTNKLNLLIRKQNFPDAVVWNPWIEKAKGMADFDDEEYKNMVCVESGYVSKRYLLKPNDTVNLSQDLIVESS